MRVRVRDAHGGHPIPFLVGNARTGLRSEFYRKWVCSHCTCLDQTIRWFWLQNKLWFLRHICWRERNKYFRSISGLLICAVCRGLLLQVCLLVLMMKDPRLQFAHKIDFECGNLLIFMPFDNRSFLSNSTECHFLSSTSTIAWASLLLVFHDSMSAGSTVHQCTVCITLTPIWIHVCLPFWCLL